MPDDSTPTSPETPPPYDPRRRVGTGLAGETTRNEGSTIRHDAPQRPLEIIGDFEVMSKLGQGGMGAVYRARQISLDRQVALKILPAKFEDDADYVSRFQREARVAASLSHPNLVKVYAAGVADGCHYIAMELIEGETLGQSIKRNALPPLEALRIILDVARALDCGWRSARLIHRDIKPGNIFLSVEGEVKLGDLGLAKIVGGDSTGLTHTGTAMGTPHYISPEQARGDRDLDFRADIYSLGCTLYQMLTKQTPYSGHEPMVVMNQHINSAPPAILKVMPQCPLPLGRLVSKMLRKQRRERPASYEELIATLESVRAQLDPSLAATIMATRTSSAPDPAQVEAHLRGVQSHPQGVQSEASPTNADEGRPGGASLPAKSKLPLYGGAGVLVLAVAAFLFWPKEEKLTRAQMYAREHAGEQQAGKESAPSAPGTSSNNAAAGNREAGRGTDSAALEPGAIRLFDTPEKVAQYVGTGFIWENGTIRLDGRRVTFSTPTARDAILRCAVRMNPDSANARLSLRQSKDSNHKDFAYYLELNPASSTVLLVATDGGADKPQHRWKLARKYLPDEWVRLELRAVGEELTVSADGAVLGTVRDGSITQPGGVTLFAVANGYFREIVYVPLDNAPNGSASTPATATKDVPFVNTLGMKFVPVPIIGGSTGGRRVLFSTWDTRVQDYEVFATETKRTWLKPDCEQGPTDPALMVSWEDAQAFCAWLTQRERKAGKLGANEVYRLPSDHEWSCAVGIGEREDAAKLPAEKSGKIADAFPWGTQWPPPAGAGNYAGEELRPAQAAGKFTYIKNVIAGYNDGFVNTSPVGSFAANRFGLYDMGGNAWQWCEDWFDKDQKDRVLRGASWNKSERDDLLSSNRINKAPGNRYGFGFRCVLATATPPASLSAASYPQPRVWIDATERVRSAGLKYGSLVVDGEWLEATKTWRPSVADGKFGNVAVRVLFANRVGMQLRHSKDSSYNAGAGSKGAGIAMYQGPAKTGLADAAIESTEVPDTAYEMVFAAQGDTLSLWLDGKEIARAKDATLTAGTAELFLSVDGKTKPPRIKKVEYGELEAAGTSQIPPTPTDPQTAAAFPPGQWVNPIPDLSKLATLAEFKDGWARLKNIEPDFHIKMPQSKEVAVFHNAGLRVRRQVPQGWTGDILVAIRRTTQVRMFELFYYPESSARSEGLFRLGEFRPDPIPAGAHWTHVKLADRAISPTDTEFTAELIAIGKTLVARINGETLTWTVDDGDRTGSLVVLGTNKLPFRDIEVLNLDGLSEADALKLVGISATSVSPSSALPASPSFTPAAATPRPAKLPDPAKWVPILDTPETRAKSKGAEWMKDVVHLNGELYLSVAAITDVAIRAKVRLGSQTSFITRLTGEGNRTALIIRPNGGGMLLQKERGKDYINLPDFPFKPSAATPQEIQLELVVVGKVWMVSVDGKVIGSILDEEEPVAGRVAVHSDGGYLHDIAWQSLDGAPTPPATAPAAARLSPSTEPWQDVLHDPAKLSFFGDVERTPEGLRIPYAGGAMLNRSLKPHNDGAVRMLGVFGGVQPEVLADGTASSHLVNAAADGEQVSLVRYDAPTKQLTRVRDFPLREPLKKGQDYELELRVVGQVFTVKLNGEILGTVTDATSQFHVFGVKVLGKTGTPALVKALEVLDLDAPAAASATPAAPRPAKLPDPAKWVPVFNAPDSLAKSKVAEWTKDGIHLNGNLQLSEAAITDVAVRAKVRLGSSQTSFITRGGACSAVIRANSGGIMLQKKKGNDYINMVDSPFKPSAATPQEIEVELVEAGKVLMVSVDGKVIGSVKDDEEPVAGKVILYSGGGHLRDIAWQSLDGAPKPPTSAPAAARLSPSTEPWQDVLHDPAKLNLSGAVERTPGGLRFTDYGYAMRGRSQGPKRDGAVRMLATFGGVRPQLLVRQNEASGQYSLYARSDKVIVLGRYETIGKQWTVLHEFALREPLQPGQDYEIELRVVGQTLTAKFNSVVLGTVTDGVIPEGNFGMAVTDHVTDKNAAPALVKALEVLDLDAPAKTTGQ